MNAIILNRILIGLVITMLVGTVAGFYFATVLLSSTATKTGHIRTDSTMTEESLASLQRLQTELNFRKDSVDRARQLVGSMEGFSYQDRVVEDLSAYAAKAGTDVQVINFRFTDPLLKPVVDPKKKVMTIPGVKILDATATLNSPVRYDNFMRFLLSIEQNLTKIQVTGINITPDKDDPRSISGPTINLQIYVREEKK